MPAAHCLACGNNLPPGKYCADCGARRCGPKSGTFRLYSFAAAPTEHVLRPWIASSLFPQLPKSSRIRFRLGLIILSVMLTGFAVMRWPVPMLGTALAGIPVLFVVYLREVHGHNPTPTRYLALATVVAAVSGVGWALLAGPIIADAYNDALGAQLGTAQKLVCWVLIPISEALLIVTPALLVRAIDRRSKVGSLDGFTIGALGALVANAASTATLLAPQLAMGLSGDTQPADSLLVEALVEGLAWPVASLATGGVFGIALWLTRTTNASRRYRRAVPAVLAVMLANMTAMGAVDIAPIPLSAYLGLQVLIALLTVLALRVAIAGALVNGRRADWRDTDTDTDTGVPCPECEHTAPRGKFCPVCGVMTPIGTPSRKAGYIQVLAPAAAGIAATVAVGMVAATLMAPAPRAYVCPPDCGKPPIGDPVETNPRFSGDDGAFSVAYPGEGSVYEATFDPPGINGVQLKYTGGDTGTMTLFGEPAEERTPKDIALKLLHTRYPAATVDYEIPNASVGYQPGYGLVADVYPRDSSSGYTRVRVIIMVATKYDYALIAMAAGPYHMFTPSYGTGHPSGANLEVAMDMGKYVNSFRWNGDRYGGRS